MKHHHVKRTRRHVVVWLTPAQAKAFDQVFDACADAPPKRQLNRLRQIAREAGRAADIIPPPAPPTNGTTVTPRKAAPKPEPEPPRGKQIRKGSTI